MAADTSVVVVRTPDELEPHVAAWDDLARAAIEPNVFQESWVVLPGWRAFGTNVDLHAILIYGPGQPNSPPGAPLNGLFLLERVPRQYGLPIPVLRGWTHQYSPLGTPLLRAGAEQACLDALFTWLSQHPDGAPLLELVDYAADGPFGRLVAACARQRRLSSFAVQTYPRALLRRDEDATAALDRSVSRGSRKELRRLRRRLEETGRVDVRSLDSGADPQQWIDQFLELERSGWKGRADTALANDPSHRSFFEQVARAAHARGRLRLLGLFLDDRPVAMKCNLLAPPGSFAYKIAYDERLARYSPGVQLELDNVAAMHAEPGIDWMDSCASEGHAMIERLWSDRRAIAVTLFATGRSLTSGLLVSALEPIRRVYRTSRGHRPDGGAPGQR